jgi:hypothetical protein
MIAAREVLKNRQSQKYHVHRINLHTEAWCTVAVPMCLWRQALLAQVPPAERVVGSCEADQEGFWLIHRVAHA